MKYIKYSKYIPNPFDDLSSEDLMRLLQDFLLQSGFSDYSSFFQMDSEQTMENLHRALLEALYREGKFPQDLLDELLNQAKDYRDSRLSEMMDQLLERLAEEGYVTISPPNPNPGEIEQPRGGGMMGQEGQAQFELTDKALDFLGFRTLKDLLGSLGKSSFGRHDTRELATGIEADGSSRKYEFGDTLNLDVNATLLSSIQRNGLQVPLELEYSDLQVRQCEYQSSCATVLMLDCSHSMILYGEDRFTPAKKVAMALRHLIKTQYPGDTLHLVLFHDTAEELPLSELARVKVGPYYTNTREG